MGMPELPKRHCTQVQLDLMEAVAMEEMALAELIRAEAQTVEVMNRHFPAPGSVAEAAEMQKLVLAILQAVHMKEMVLVERLKFAARLRCYEDDTTESDYTDLRTEGDES